MLRTGRLLLRLPEEDDVAALEHVLGDPEVMRFVGGGTPLDLPAIRAWVRGRAEPIEPGLVTYLVVAGTGEAIGYCGIERGEDTGLPELVYALARPYWGNGYALEAARAVLADRGTALPPLWATADPENGASLRVLEELGFSARRVGRDVHGLATVFLQRPG